MKSEDMNEASDDGTAKAQPSRASAIGSAKGFVEPGTDPERFKFTEAEQAHMQRILDWQEMSAKCTMVFGPSIECPNCHVMNNPNNPHCHQCHERL